MSRVVVTIVANNRMKFLPEALAALEEQTFKELQVIVVDNASTDGLESYLRGHHPKMMIMRNVKNLGYSRAQNQAIAYVKTHLQPEAGELFLLTLDPSIVLEPNCVERMVNGLQADRRNGCAGAKVLRSAVSGEGEFIEHAAADVIDSAGLRLSRARRPSLRAAGTKDGSGNFPYGEEVFGLPGALALYRFEALEDARRGQEYFDEDFFTYLADVDLAWRLRDRGWTAVLIRAARACHRGVAVASPSWFAAWREWLALPAAARSLMRRNRLLLVLKNDRFVNLLAHSPWLLGYGVGCLAYCCLIEPATLSFLPRALAALPSVAAERFTARKGRAKAGAVRAWLK